MNGENTACRCGHSVDSHFLDTVRPTDANSYDVGKHFRGACLGMLCDCKRYAMTPAGEREGRLR